LISIAQYATALVRVASTLGQAVRMAP
jgi:hypothetical protein